MEPTPLVRLFIVAGAAGAVIGTLLGWWTA